MRSHSLKAREYSSKVLERSYRISETEAENEKLLDMVNSLEAELKSWNSRCEQLEAERASLSGEINGLETDCEMYEEGIAAYESDLRDLNAV